MWMYRHFCRWKFADFFNYLTACSKWVIITLFPLTAAEYFLGFFLLFVIFFNGKNWLWGNASILSKGFSNRNQISPVMPSRTIVKIKYRQCYFGMKIPFLKNTFNIFCIITKMIHSQSTVDSLHKWYVIWWYMINKSRILFSFCIISSQQVGAFYMAVKKEIHLHTGYYETR